jgi:transposase
VDAGEGGGELFFDVLQAAVFDAENPEKDAQKEADTEKLYAQIGQLKMENDWLKKKLH